MGYAHSFYWSTRQGSALEYGVEIEKIEELVSELLKERGFELVDLEYQREPKGRVLRLFIDREGGITLDDCSYVSELLGPKLDRTELIKESYLLEVSSPGIERRLKKAKDFIRFKGSKIAVKTTEPIEGRRNITGMMISADDNRFVVEAEGRAFEVSYENLAKAHLVVDIKL